MTPDAPLTPLEARILRLRRAGMSHEAIAAEAATSEKTSRRLLREMAARGIDVPQPFRAARGPVTNTSPDSPWTPERIERMRELWLAGKTAETIAMDLGNGITRNSVIGKVNRLGLTRSSTGPRKRAMVSLPGGKKKPQSRRDNNNMAKRMKRAKQEPHVTQRKEATMVPLIDCVLTYSEHSSQRHCGFVVGEPKQLLHCGHKRLDNSPYCARHHALTHTPAPPNRNVLPMRREWAA